MTWKPIIAGVDLSPEGAWAAATAWRLARAAGVPCHLIHVVTDVTIPPGGTPGVADVAAFRAAVLPVAREQVREALAGNAPPECLDAIEIAFGRPGKVLARIAAERSAAMIVVGGKRHSHLDRWLAGSTALDAVRTAKVPTFVTTTSVAEIRRVLAAVDSSAVARRTIEAAWTFAELVGAELRVLHALEPVTTLGPPAPAGAAAAAALEQAMPPEVASERDVERVVRPGWARQVIAQEATQWDAQVVVVGSHRKDWVDRVMLGSVTEGLLQNLPASLLVVPPHWRAGAQSPGGAQRQRPEPAPR